MGLEVTNLVEMSAEEDTELRDLVAKTLENNGVLAKIRAELRASVFLALEEQETKSAPFENRALKEYLKSPQAALGLCIVREFLEYLELDFTLSVYNTETSHGKGYEYSGRNKLVKDLKIQNLNDKKGPILSHILQIAQEHKGIHTNNKEEKLQVHAGSSPLSPGEGSHQNISTDLGTSIESPDVSLTPLDRTFTSDGSTVKGILGLCPTNDDFNKTKIGSSKQPPVSIDSQGNVVGKQDMKTNDTLLSQTKSDSVQDPKPLVNNESCPPKGFSLNKINEAKSNDRKGNLEGEQVVSKVTKQEVKNPMASLNDLPPLESLQGRKHFNNADCINLLDLGLQQDDYEEDFISTDSSAAIEENSKSHSHSRKSGNKQGAKKKEPLMSKKISKDSEEKETSDKTGHSPIGSISEDIDDDTNSACDELLNSTASTENTVDTTISHLKSNFADYMEDI